MAHPTNLAAITHANDKAVKRIRGICYHANGLIAVEQCEVNGWTITYNPDDDRFWATDANGVMGHTFKADEKGMANGRHWCKKHSATTGNTEALQGRPEGNCNPGPLSTDAEILQAFVRDLRMRRHFRLASAVEEHTKTLLA